MVKATWMDARSQPCFCPIGPTNSVQPYWRLAIITMQTMPIRSCSQRPDGGCAAAVWYDVMVSFPARLFFQAVVSSSLFATVGLQFPAQHEPEPHLRRSGPGNPRPAFAVSAGALAPRNCWAAWPEALPCRSPAPVPKSGKTKVPGEMPLDSVMQPPFKPIEFLSRDVNVEKRDDGTILLQSNHALKPYERHVPAFLAKWAAQAPDRVWLAQRRGPDRDWLKVTYAEARKQVDAVTQALLDRGFGPDRPVMILSSNSIEFALLSMAAMQARAPLAPVSPAYSVMSQDHAKLRYVFDLIKPGLVFVQNGGIYADALAALDLDGVLVVHVDKPPPKMQSLPWSELVATTPTDAVARSIERIEPRTVGKFLFTSGSTGMPKAVINTQEMMCANLAMGQMARTRRPDDPSPVQLDWLPWNHTMGGNATFQGNLAEGGTTYIDDGKPLPGLFEETLRNLREVSSTYFANVPAGYAMLATALEKEEWLAKRFFKNLNSLAYGGATLPSDPYQRMETRAVKHTGYRMPSRPGGGPHQT